MAKRTQENGQSKPNRPVPASSMDYRPPDYFGWYDPQVELLTTIRTVTERKAIRKAIDQGQISTVSDYVKRRKLVDHEQQLTESIPADYMGGQYLPNVVLREREIARICVTSPIDEVACVYAIRDIRRIRYRVVDEYAGLSIGGPAEHSSNLPLTMGELIQFFLGAWNLYGFVAVNNGGCLKAMLEDFSGESEFYPCFDAALRELVIQRFPGEDPEEDPE